VIVGAAHEAAWRNLASHLHGEGRHNAKDASFYWKPYTLQYRLDSRTSCPLLLRWASTKLKSGRHPRSLKEGLLRTGHFFTLLGRCREAGFSGRSATRSHKRRSHTFSSHRFYYNFTEITITTPPLTRILDRLIGGGISLCSNGVWHSALWLL
jgi:hypothetical protein